MPRLVSLAEGLSDSLKRGAAGRIHLQALFGVRHLCPALTEFLCEISF